MVAKIAIAIQLWLVQESHNPASALCSEWANQRPSFSMVCVGCWYASDMAGSKEVRTGSRNNRQKGRVSQDSGLRN